MRWQDTLVKTSSIPYYPQPSLLRSLFSLDDGRLRLRWSDFESKWALERKSTFTLEYINTLPRYRTQPNGYKVENDSWIRARDGYVLIGHYDPEPHLGHWVIDRLRFYDMRRFSGGWKEVDLLMCREEEQKQKQQDHHYELVREGISKDFFEREQWRQGNRAAVPKHYGKISKFGSSQRFNCNGSYGGSEEPGEPIWDMPKRTLQQFEPGASVGMAKASRDKRIKALGFPKTTKKERAKWQ